MLNRIKNNLEQSIPRSRFIRAVSILVGGTAVAQLLLILASPLLTRLYSPEDFGLLAVYVSVLSILGVISSLRYELAIPLPEDTGEAVNIVSLCLIILISSSTMIGILLIFFGSVITSYVGTPHFTSYLWLIPVGLLVTGIFSIFRYWNIRTENFSRIAKAKLLQSVITISIQLAAFKFGATVLLMGQLVGVGVGSTALVAKVFAKKELAHVSIKGMRKASLRYRHFPMFSSFAGLVNVAGQQLPPIIFAIFFSISSAGLYALAHRILTLPSALISGAIGNVFLSHAAVALRENRLNSLYFKLQDMLIQVGLPPTLIVIITGGDVFALVFEEEWRVAGNYSEWLVVGVFAGFVVSPLSQIFIVLEKQKISLILQVILFFARLCAITVGVLYESLLLTVILFSGASFFGYFLYVYVGAKYTGNPIRKTFLSCCRASLFSIFSCLPIIVVYIYGSGDVVHLVMALIVSGSIISIRNYRIFKYSSSKVF